jgi:uncharacterized protein (DUF2062 family)
MLRFLRRRLIDPLLALLTQGITPQKLALSIAIGAIVGIFPVLGSTTVPVRRPAAPAAEKQE